MAPSGSGLLTTSRQSKPNQHSPSFSQRQSVYWVGVQDISFTQIKFRPSRFGLVAADCDKSCPNGGTCLGAANGTFHCRCALGYTGRRCESTNMPALPCFCFLLANYIDLFTFNS